MSDTGRAKSGDVREGENEYRNEISQGLDPSRQFKNGDFRRSVKTDGDPDGADPPIDVELPPGLLEIAFHIGSQQSRGREIRTDEFQRDLPPVRVSCQAEINAEVCRPIKSVGVMAEQNVDRLGAQQVVNSFQILANKPFIMVPHAAMALEINANQIEAFAVSLNGGPLLAENFDPLSGE